MLPDDADDPRESTAEGLSRLITAGSVTADARVANPLSLLVSELWLGERSVEIARPLVLLAITRSVSEAVRDSGATRYGMIDLRMFC